VSYLNSVKRQQLTVKSKESDVAHERMQRRRKAAGKSVYYLLYTFLIHAKTREIGGKISVQCKPFCTVYLLAHGKSEINQGEVSKTRENGGKISAMYLLVYCTVPAGPLGM
jgi:hypothetical protein